MQAEPLWLFFSSNLLLMLGRQEGGLPLIAAVTPHQAEGSSAGRGEGRRGGGPAGRGPDRTGTHIVFAQPAGRSLGAGGPAAPQGRRGPRAPLQERCRRRAIAGELRPVPSPSPPPAAGLVRPDGPPRPEGREAAG